tara:strand:- start:281 stop:877 length:597 start_codon:yes stop_codon:yes gene_type:complete
MAAGISLAALQPAAAQIDSSDATFREAVQAVKDKDFRHAVRLFTIQAENDQHDAQYNLALLLEAGKGAPQDFLKALTWAWAAQLGGIEAAEELAEDLAGYLPEKSIETVREAVQERLRARIDKGHAAAVSQFATFHLLMLEEPDHETAYIWFSISAALGLEGALEARDDARENVDGERIIELQTEAGTIYESLEIIID